MCDINIKSRRWARSAASAMRACKSLDQRCKSYQFRIIKTITVSVVQCCGKQAEILLGRLGCLLCVPPGHSRHKNKISRWKLLTRNVRSFLFLSRIKGTTQQWTGRVSARMHANYRRETLPNNQRKMGNRGMWSIFLHVGPNEEIGQGSRRR